MNGFPKAAEVDHVFLVIFNANCNSSWKLIHVTIYGFRKPFMTALAAIEFHFDLKVSILKTPVTVFIDK
jgi:hypothetical protein